MAKSRILHYLKLGLEALFLLNFSLICVLCFFWIFGPVLLGGGFFQSFIWGMMLQEISSSYIIIAIRIFLFLSSVYLWFRKQTWLTAAYLIIAGTGAGFLGSYFFILYYFSFFGCLGVLLFCFGCHLILKYLKSLAQNPCFQRTYVLWKKFWTWPRAIVACAIIAAVLWPMLSPWELPLFGKPLPYAITGHSWSGGTPPHKQNISIAIDMEKYRPSSADLAATCAAAARNFNENYGFPDISVEIYDYLSEINNKDQCFVNLATCRYSPDGFYILEQNKDLKAGWSKFKVARDIPLKEIRECNQLMQVAPADLAERDDFIRKKMGYWAYNKLTPSLQKVIFEILPDNLCEKPIPWKEFGITFTRKKLVEECEGLAAELKAIGSQPDFPACYKNGCANKTYKAWARRKFLLWSEREGNFIPEIGPYDTTIDALAKAYSEKDLAKAASLEERIAEILDSLKKTKVCGKN